MTNAANGTRRSRRRTRRLIGGGIVAGLLFGGIAAAVPAFAANASPVAAATVTANAAPAAEATIAEELSPYVMPAPGPVERGVPGVGLSIFVGTALTVGAGGIVTARLLAHRHHVAHARARA